MAVERFNKGEVVEAVMGELRSRYMFAVADGLEHVFEGGESMFDARRWQEQMVGVSALMSVAQELGIEVDRAAEHSRAMRRGGDHFAYKNMGAKKEQREKVRSVLDGYGLYDVRVVLAEYEIPAHTNGKG